MARKPRVHHPGAHYHVMLRGNGGMTIFQDHVDRRKLLDLVWESVNRFEYRIHAFCFMTNHVHFSMQVGEIPLSKIIQNISFRYTRFINKKQKRIGHLFQGRYKALLVDADSYLLQLVRYIHLNPIRANMVASLVDYPWSSHLDYLGQITTPWLTKQYVIDLLATNKCCAVIAYQQFMLDDTHDAAIDFDASTQKSFPAICDDGFMQKLASLQTMDKQVVNMTLSSLVKLVCAYYAVSESVLHVRSQKRLPSKVRVVIAWLAVQFGITSITGVAVYFGRDVATLSRSLGKVLESDGEGLVKARCYVESAIAQA